MIYKADILELILSKVFNLAVDTLCIKTIFMKKLCRRAGLTEYIVDSDTFNRYRSLLSQTLAYSSAKSANDRVLLNSYNFACFFGSCNNKLLIKRFNGVDIDNFCIDSVCCKLLSCLKSRSNAKSVCNDGKIFSLAENNTFTCLLYTSPSPRDRG